MLIDIIAGARHNFIGDRSYSQNVDSYFIEYVAHKNGGKKLQ
jgi:hypothetical protein